MQRNKQAALAALAILSSTAVGAVAAEQDNGATLSGNLAATSTYVWRGRPQTVDTALQGGVDYKTKEGLHAGAWTSSTITGGEVGSELDFTVGFAGNASGFGYDVGLILYMFPQAEAAAGPGEDYDFNELYASISKDQFSLAFYTSSDAGDYLDFNANFEKVIGKWDLGLHLGSYSVDNDYWGPLADDYKDYSVSLGTTINGLDVSFALSDTDLTDDSYRTIITIGKNFTP
jgi:uncharacterized protein (TIGR02001 family)